MEATLLKRLRTLAGDTRITRIERALGKDAKLCLVGGAVRDAVLGGVTRDLDLASALLPAEVKSRLEQGGIKVYPIGLRHQTVAALPVEDEEIIEITTFRGKEMSPDSGVVASQTVEEDLQYRDFTVNALAFELQSETLIDPCGGLNDLKKQLIRCPGIPRERFREDPLRCLRLVRFACQLNFQIDLDTAIHASEFAASLAAVSAERIRDELTKILLSPEPRRGFQLLDQLGFLGVVLPELQAGIGFEQNEFHTSDVFEHTLEVVSKTEPELMLRLSALFHDVGKPFTLSVDSDGHRHFYHHEKVGAEMTKEILTRLRFPGAVTDGVVKLVATHMRPIEAGPGGLRRLLRDTDELFPVWRALKEADSASVKIDPIELQERLRQFDEAIEDVKKGPPVSPLKSLAINGSDLLALGMPESRALGDLLKALHEEVLDNPDLNTKEQLLERAKSCISKALGETN